MNSKLSFHVRHPCVVELVKLFSRAHNTTSSEWVAHLVTTALRDQGLLSDCNKVNDAAVENLRKQLPPAALESAESADGAMQGQRLGDVGTSALRSRLQEEVLRFVPPSVRSLVALRVGTPSARTGRCLFAFGALRADQVAVAVVAYGGKATNQYYVIPAAVCPAMLFLRPAQLGKWSSYAVWATPQQLAHVIAEMSSFKPATL